MDNAWDSCFLLDVVFGSMKNFRKKKMKAIEFVISYGFHHLLLLVKIGYGIEIGITR